MQIRKANGLFGFDLFRLFLLFHLSSFLRFFLVFPHCVPRVSEFRERLFSMELVRWLIESISGIMPTKDGSTGRRPRLPASCQA
ncbi:uncharacterized protein BKA78DRAFT_315968 [Phyllosticta capitalensis]|uniref:uncharacterized protein n=1 Tax=Phyllosticta capitalensis TaxID=121624 RepID=UPI003130E717